MNKIKQVFIICPIILLLAGCHLLGQKDNVRVSPPIINGTPDGTGVVDTPPKIVKETNWNQILSPFVDKILHSSEAGGANNLILISDIQNRSGDYLATNQIDNALYQLMSKQNTYTVVDKKAVNQAKQTLGISADDKLVSRSKMIGLAKSLSAGYVLFTTIYKLPTDTDNANVAMELLSTQSGEILTRATSKDFPSQPKTQPNTDTIISAPTTSDTTTIDATTTNTTTGVNQ